MQGVVFRHADGSVYGDAVAPEDLEASAEAFEALKALGLRDGEARRAQAAARAHVGASPSAEDLVRAALRREAAPVGRVPQPQQG
jgi:Holliday junction resolvasome RuvABC DNA-binding subunit